MFRTLNGLHEETRYQVRLGATKGDPYLPNKGLREGCSTSPILFDVFHDESTRQATAARQQLAADEGLGGVGLQWKVKSDLRLGSQRSTMAKASGAEDFTIDKILFEDDSNLLGYREEIQGDQGWPGAIGPGQFRGLEQCTHSMKRNWDETEHPDKREWVELGTPNGAKY